MAFGGKLYWKVVYSGGVKCRGAVLLILISIIYNLNNFGSSQLFPKWMLPR